MSPQQLTTSLSNLVAWFPTHDPFELLQQNPQILENPNVEADPTYGKWGGGVWVCVCMLTVGVGGGGRVGGSIRNQGVA
jgi:hypothetical protein